MWLAALDLKKSRKATEHYLIIMKALYLHDPNWHTLTVTFWESFVILANSLSAALSLWKSRSQIFDLNIKVIVNYRIRLFIHNLTAGLHTRTSLIRSLRPLSFPFIDIRIVVMNFTSCTIRGECDCLWWF